MNPLDDQLDRLFRAARPDTAVSLSAPPYGLETRVLAAWRGRGEGAGMWSGVLLGRGLLLASLITALSWLPALTRTTSPETQYLQLADSSLQLDNTP